MSTYSAYPSLEALTIDERTDAFRRTSLNALQQGFSMAEMLQAKAEGIANEQYEMVAGIDLALKEFEENPQLSLFQRIIGKIKLAATT